MKLILAVSADGFLCKGPDDDMSWTGKTDKAIFKLLTMDGGRLFAGSKTYSILPLLEGRRVYSLCSSRFEAIVDDRQRFTKDWLVGGPTVAIEALCSGLIEVAYICKSPVTLTAGVAFEPIKALLEKNYSATNVVIGDVTVSVYHPNKHP